MSIFFLSLWGIVSIAFIVTLIIWIINVSKKHKGKVTWVVPTGLFVIGLLCFIIGIMSQGGSSNDDASVSSSSEKTPTKHHAKQTAAQSRAESASLDAAISSELEAGAPKKQKTIEVDSDDYKVADSKKFNITSTDSNWVGTNVNIDSATVYKLAAPSSYDSASDGKITINGFVQLHMSITAAQDIEIYPTQGTVILSNGEQHDADNTDEGWDGDVAAGVTKSGTVTIPVTNINSVDDLMNVRFKFDAFYDTDDLDDENSDHSYDLSFDLNN